MSRLGIGGNPQEELSSTSSFRSIKFEMPETERLREAAAYRAAVEDCESAEQLGEYLEHGRSALKELHTERLVMEEAVALYGKHMSTLLLQNLWENGKGRFLLKNPHVDRVVLQESARVGVDEISRQARRKSLSVHGDPALSLAEYVRAGLLRMNSSEGERLLQVLKDGSADLRPGVLNGTVVAAVIIVATADLSTDTSVLSFLATCDKRTTEQYRILLCAHPNADISVWEQLLGDAPWEENSLLALARIEKARKEPRVRAALESFGSFCAPQVLRELMRDVQGAEFREMFLTVHRRDERLAVEALNESSAEQRAALKREDMLMLLSSPNADIRLFALASSSALEAPEKSAPSAAPESRQKRGARK